MRIGGPSGQNSAYPTSHLSKAVGMMLEICGSEARFTTPVQIYDCALARNPALEALLRPILFGGGWRSIRDLSFYKT
jgi:hypothetical protein